MGFSFKGFDYRVIEGEVQRRAADSRRWETCSRSSLLAHAVDSELWNWLRDQGVTRPSPSGEVSEDARGTVAVKLRLDPAAARDLDKLAAEDGTTKSATVAGLVAKERARRDRR